MRESDCSEVVEIARRAGERILEVYEAAAGIDVEHKDDKSPLTQADLAAHEEILRGLRALTPNIPVLSEESEPVPWKRRREWNAYWLVDPLDGTKEFINRNGEFTVNIALVRDGEPVLGVVHVPVTGVTYWGDVDRGASKAVGNSAPDPITVRSIENLIAEGGVVTIVASRRHRGEELDHYLQRIEERFGEISTASMGSSLKICLVAEGKADIYPRLAPTCEWDTAAAQAVLEAAGGHIVDTDFRALRYNRKEAMLNPHFLAIGDPGYPWPDVLG